MFDPNSEIHKRMMASLPDHTEEPHPEKPKPTLQEFWRGSDVPTRFRRDAYSLSQFGQWNDKLNALKDKLKTEPGMICVLRGPRGTGKTQLAVELLKHAACELGLSTLFTSARDIQLITTSSFKDKEVTDMSVLHEFIKPKVLLIDEFDWQPLDKAHYFNSNLFYILDKRYAWCRSTILTSNATVEEFNSRVDPGILSRMTESGGRIDCDNWANQRIQRRIKN